MALNLLTFFFPNLNVYIDKQMIWPDSRVGGQPNLHIKSESNENKNLWEDTTWLMLQK